MASSIRPPASGSKSGSSTIRPIGRRPANTSDRGTCSIDWSARRSAKISPARRSKWFRSRPPKSSGQHPAGAVSADSSPRRIGIVAAGGGGGVALGLCRRPGDLARSQSRIAARSADPGKPRPVRAGRFDRLSAKAEPARSLFLGVGTARSRRRRAWRCRNHRRIRRTEIERMALVDQEHLARWHRSLFQPLLLWPKTAAAARESLHARLNQDADGRQTTRSAGELSRMARHALA